MQICDAAAKRVAPLVHSLVGERHSIKTVALEKRVLGSIRAMNIEFALQEFVHRVVERKRGHRRPLHTQPHIEIGAPLTF